MAEPSRAPAWLGLGANLGDREATLAEAVARIAALPGTRVAAASSLYRTAPWGDPDQPDFLNAALAIETGLAPYPLLRACLAIEADLGRVRGRRWGPRIVDIDILAYEGVALADPVLTLPHPRLTERAFALVPLAEIAPDLVISGKPVSAWLAGLDASGVTRVDGGAR